MVAFRVGPFGTWVRLLLETWKFTVQTEEPIVSAGGPGEILLTFNSVQDNIFI